MDNKVRRICLFAGFNHGGVVADYVLYYIKQLSELSEVHYCCDCELSEADRLKLLGFIKTVHSGKHGKYDFGSWSKLINTLGYNYLSSFDELIIANDSVFGPLWALKPYFTTAEQEKNCDFWGFTSHEHKKQQYLNSFFMVFSRKVFLSNVFKRILSSVKHENNYYSIVENYEVKLTLDLQQAGFVPRVFLPFSAKDLRYEYKHYIRAGLPFIKVRNFTDLSSVPRDIVYDFEDFFNSENIKYPALNIKDYIASLDMSVLRKQIRLDS